MKTTIEGYAFKANEVELRAANADRMDALRALLGTMHMKKALQIETSSRYGENVHTGNIPSGVTLSPKDIALICDDGNTCFGGWVDLVGNKFTCGIWTD